MSKNDALKIMKNSNLNVKCGLLSYFFVMYKNERNNLLSKKQRSSTK